MWEARWKYDVECADVRQINCPDTPRNPLLSRGLSQIR